MMVRYFDAAGKPIVGFKILGKIPAAEYGEVNRQLQAALDTHGRVRMLFHMVEPSVLQPAPFWKDIELSLDHLADVERVAIIGPPRWLEGYRLAIEPTYPTIEVQQFTLSEKNRAWNWIQQGLQEPVSSQ